MDERPANADTPDYAEAPVDPEPIEAHDTQANLEPPEYVEADPEEPPIDLDTDNYVDTSLDEEAATSLEQIDYHDLPPDEAPALDLEPAEEAEDYAEVADLEPPASGEFPPETEISGFPAALVASEAPGSAALYQAFVPRRMRRDRVAAMSYPSAIEMVSRQRRKGDPAALGDLDMSDEEIAAAIQDYARGVDTEEERTNWLLGQILEEQQRQTRHLRGVRTVLILLIAALALAAIASCVLTFVQFPSLMP